ncbi:glutathione S-transferase family protein [Caldimonas thermodepolymerans]|uniref:Glutathione S-transferase family protein n=1 Tax=Caldimonas thermodepolymerans TaxID=215580 RepID=A0A2S5T535_9BURK|nr:glutathione S-transferase family protein [Caldimonas thermodepolymerans]PPE70110.1 glutathione S-transferase family protein [Caldimonas thermodepolymerans]QPC31694.1 glutathione S-transferase family protein [Caldimonas thermodepolymerans]RDI01805.1 glutathione S-transferase [Caldimonas thermodepolymerans]UZG44479.1 glutathione S-transferase family protein [Caldimonas thermodepolymerans]
MLKLYFHPQSRGQIARWMLDEAGAEYELVHVDLQQGEHKRSEFLAINPAGKLPALVDGDVRVYENPAICLYVAEKHPEARLAPPPGAPGRGRFLSLMVYSTAQLEPSMGEALLKLPHHPARGWTPFDAAQDVVERELGDGPYLFGDWFTAADVMIGSMFIWKRWFGGPPDRPRIAAYVDRLLQRPRCSMRRE